MQNMDRSDEYDLGCLAASQGDYPGAVAHWRRAAARGHTQAKYNLGVAYARGRGVNRSETEARHWWSEAAADGHGTASKLLASSGGAGIGSSLIGGAVLPKKLDARHAALAFAALALLFLGLWANERGLFNSEEATAYADKDRETNACQLARVATAQIIWQTAPLYNYSVAICSPMKFFRADRSAKVWITAYSNGFEVSLDGSGPLWRVLDIKRLR